MKQLLLETERLWLRPFALGDEDQVLVFSSNPVINKYTGDPIITTLDGVTDLIKNVWLSDYKKFGYGRYAVIAKESKTILGFCGVKYLPEIDETDLGYRLIPNYWGKGIATEASKAILEHAFNDLNLKRIVATVYPENTASTRVLKKLNFQFEKKASYPDEEAILDWYVITKEDYERS